MLSVFPQNFKDAYTMAAVPTRYALERKSWAEAAGPGIKTQQLSVERL
jgi:hypothetical protein